MANVKNFGLVGVGSTVQFGKAGPSLGQESTTVLRADGTAAFRLPVGTVAQRPTGAAGMLRFNDDADQMEYYNGTTWATLATGGAAVEEVVGVTDRVTVDSSDPTAPIVDIASTYVGQSSITTLGTIGTGTWQGTVVGPTYGGTGVNNGSNTLTLAGNLATSGAFDSTFTMTGATAVTFPTTGTLATVAEVGAVQDELDATQVSLGAGIDPTDGTFDAAAFTGAGLGTVTSFTDAINTVANAAAGGIQDITLTQPAAGLTITEGGTATEPTFTFALANDLAALEALATTGYIVRTGDGTAVTRAVEGNAGRIVVTNGDGVSSDTSIDLDTVTNPGNGGTFVKVTTDTYGRVTNSTAVVASDITSLVDSAYVNVTGDTMSGDLVMGTNYVTMNNAPTTDTQAANKAYVDAVAAGLTWKTAVLAGTTADITLANEQTIDGVAVVAGNRVLVKNQTLPEENGIYIVVDGGAWTRSTDADTPAELDSATVFVQQGTANADTGWTQTTTIVTVGTTAQNWVQFSGSSAYTWGTGLGNSGNTVFVNMGAGITELPGDEVGIHLFDNATSALILTSDGTTRSEDAGDSLHLLLAGSGGLSQGAGGLTISAAGVTNAMLVNDGITTNADTGTGSLDLGGELEIQGNSTQGIVTSVTGSVFTITASNATSSQKGVASFDTGDFTVTAGNVVLNAIDLTSGVTGILPVPNGGTGVATLGANQVMIGNGTGAVLTSSALSFVTDTLTVGSATIQGVAAGDTIITATGTNGDVVLVPNGTGAVVIGPSGAGVIESELNEALTVQASGTGVLSLGSGGDIVMVLPANDDFKVTVSGPTPAEYATGLANADLVNKYYVDEAVSSATVAGDVISRLATVNLNVATPQNIGAALPAGATVLSVKVNVTSAAATGALEVGKTGDTDAYMTGAENDTQATGLYLAECMVTEGGSEQVIATVTGTPAAGSATVVITYRTA